MSLRLEMLQVARVAPAVLGDATELVRNFLASQQNPDGGFRDRDGESDLYYTVFGLRRLGGVSGRAGYGRRRTIPPHARRRRRP